MKVEIAVNFGQSVLAFFAQNVISVDFAHVR